MPQFYDDKQLHAYVPSLYPSEEYFATIASRWLSLAPATSATFWLSLYSWNVGIATTLHSIATSYNTRQFVYRASHFTLVLSIHLVRTSSASTSTLRNLMSVYFLLNCSQNGAIRAHGLHHEAVKSTTNYTKLANVTWVYRKNKTYTSILSTGREFDCNLKVFHSSSVLITVTPPLPVVRRRRYLEDYTCDNVIYT